MDVCTISTPCGFMLKRKRAANVVISDSESDDDNLTISQVMAKRLAKANCDANDLSMTTLSPSTSDDDDDNDDEDVRDAATPRRRRFRRRIYVANNGTKHGISKTMDDADASEEVEGSDVSGDSIEEFSDRSSDNSDASDCDKQMEEIVSWLSRRRNRGREFNWKLSGEMLRDLGEDDELCMSAVCAIYRRQTDDEQGTKSTVDKNHRGFSQPDAYIGSKIAAFLIGPLGDVSKSVEELQAYKPKKREVFDGVDVCRRLAMKYSDQLFDIYKNKQDHFFPPALDNN